MRKITLGICTLLILSGLASCGSSGGPSNPNLRTLKMTGHVIGVNDQNGHLASPVNIGDQMTISFTYDKTTAPTPDSNAAYAFYDCYGPPNSLTAQIGSSKFMVNTQNSADLVFEIYVKVGGGSQDQFTMFTQGHVTSNLSFPHNTLQVNVDLHDTTTAAFPNDLLPVNAPDPAKFAYRIMTIQSGDDPPNFMVVQAQVDTIELN